MVTGITIHNKLGGFLLCSDLLSCWTPVMSLLDVSSSGMGTTAVLLFGSIMEDCW